MVRGCLPSRAMDRFRFCCIDRQLVSDRHLLLIDKIQRITLSILQIVSAIKWLQNPKTKTSPTPEQNNNHTSNNIAVSLLVICLLQVHLKHCRVEKQRTYAAESIMRGRLLVSCYTRPISSRTLPNSAVESRSAIYWQRLKSRSHAFQIHFYYYKPELN